MTKLADITYDHTQMMRRAGLAPGTIRNRRYLILALSNWARSNHTPFWDLSTSQIETWLDATGMSSPSRRVAISHLRVFWGWAIEEEHATTDPTMKLTKIKTPRRLPQPVPVLHLKSAYETATTDGTLAGLRSRAILSLMSYQGLRCGGVATLNLMDVDREAGSFLVREKGDKERTLPLHPETAAALDAYHAALDRELRTRGDKLLDGPVIRSLHDPRKGIRSAQVGLIVKNLLPGTWTAHKIRHRFGTDFYRACRDILLTQQMMGHQNPATTAGYALADTSKAATVLGEMPVFG